MGRDDLDVGVIFQQQVPQRLLWELAMAHLARTPRVDLRGALSWAAHQLLELADTPCVLSRSAEVHKLGTPPQPVSFVRLVVADAPLREGTVTLSIERHAPGEPGRLSLADAPPEDG